MKLKWLVLSVLAFSLTLLGPTMVKAHAAAAYGAAAAAGATQDRDDWDRPPADYRDVQQRGYHEGVEAARHDFEHHRHADADDHDQYRHPHVPHEDRDAYREAFRHGYERAMAHLAGNHDHDHN